MLRPALLLMSGRMVGFVAAFFVPLVLVRLLSQSQFGTYKQLFLVFGTLFPLAQLGMAESLYYFLPTARRESGRYLVNAIATLAASGGLAFVALTAGAEPVSRWLNNPALAANLPLIGIYLLLMLTATVLEIGMVAREQYRRAALTYAVSDVGKALLLVVPVLLFGSLRALLYGAIGFAVVRVIATLLHVSRTAERLRPARSVLRRQIAYTAPFQIAVVFEILWANAHFYAVSAFYDVTTYAIYAVGCLQIPLVDFIGSSVGNVLMVKMRRAAEAGDTPSVLDLWRYMTRKLAFLFFPLTAILLLTAPDLIVLLFTTEYRGAIPVFMLWSVFTALSIVDTDSVMRVFAQMRYLALINAAGLGATVVLVAVLLPQLGLPGGVLAILLATLLREALALRRFRHLLGVRWGELLPWSGLARIGVVAAAAAVPVLLTVDAVADTHLERLIAICVVYGLAYVALTLAAGVLDAEERRALLTPLRRFRRIDTSPGLPAVQED